MPGAGSATVAYAVETDYLAGVGQSPTYRLPGADITVGRLELTNQLREIRPPDDPTPVAQLAQNFEGAVEVSWVLSGNDFHDLVFSEDGDGSGTNDAYGTDLFPSSEWYMGVDYPSGTAERVLQGVVPTEWSVEYTGTDVEVSMSCVYGDEKFDTTLTPGSIARDTADKVPGHGTDLSIDGTVQNDRLQSATLTVSDISRVRRGVPRQPVDAVVGPVSISLDVEADFDGTDLLELAYGGAGASAVQDSVDGVDASLTFATAGGSIVADYSLSGLTPENYDWQSLVDDGANLTEPVTFSGTDITAAE
jgi:hypothetical protein